MKHTLRLDMKTPSVHPGLNQTIRSGDKWLSAQPGDKLDIYETGGTEVIAKGMVIASTQTMIDDIIDCPEVLRFNHAPGGRNAEGLSQAMDAAYGPGWSYDPIVILWFWVDECPNF